MIDTSRLIIVGVGRRLNNSSNWEIRIDIRRVYSCVNADHIYITYRIIWVEIIIIFMIQRKYISRRDKGCLELDCIYRDWFRVDEQIPTVGGITEEIPSLVIEGKGRHSK